MSFSKNKELVKLLKEKHLTISFVESFSGGLAASKIVEISGSSEIFLGSLVAYSSLIKENVLKINSQLIDKYSVISKECSEEMAKKGQELFFSDIVVSFTGNAGPSSCVEDSTVGLVFMSILFKNKIYSYKKHYELVRNELREAAVEFIFDEIIKIIQKNG